MQFECSCMYVRRNASRMGVCAGVCVLTRARPCVHWGVPVCVQVPTYCTLPAVHFHAPQSQSSGYLNCCCCSYSHLPKAKHRMIEQESESARLFNTLPRKIL